MEDDRVSILEAQLAQAKMIAEEADKKYEEVRKSCFHDDVRGTGGSSQGAYQRETGLLVADICLCTLLVQGQSRFLLLHVVSIRMLVSIGL